MLPPGQRIGKYQVEEYIGQGGMAVVYRVRHAELDSVFALKLLTAPRPDVRDRLVREGRFQATLRHPNVVAVHDILEVGGSTALLMELVEGPTLDRWLRRHQPTLDEAESLFRGIVQGVAEAHHQGLVHRDLKPSNVLLAPTAAGFVPKVCDFGIAKILESESEADTRANVAMGTPYYMAPEQIRDAKTVDQRADIFSLGCILFELVCGGERSFVGNDILTVLNAVVQGKHLDPRDYIPTLEDRVVRVIDGCLKVDREDRFQDCLALLDAMGDDRGRGRVTRGLGDSSTEWETDEDRLNRERWRGNAQAATTLPKLKLGDLSTADEETTQPPWLFPDPDETTLPRLVPPAGLRAGLHSEEPTDLLEEPTVPPLGDVPNLAADPLDGDAFTQPPLSRRQSMAGFETEDGETTEPRAFQREAPASTQSIVLAVLFGMVLGMLLLGGGVFVWQGYAS